MRNFEKTAEPKGGKVISSKSGDYMIHMHDASHLHYDLRLEWRGVLKSWAVPKGPSLNPADKRLAIRTEDHPDEYKHFEGVIPEGSYGAGPSLIWDKGRFEPIGDFDSSLKKGKIKFEIKGKKLRGAWNLVRMRKSPKEQWLLIKEKDSSADPEKDISDMSESVVSGKSLEDLRKTSDIQTYSPQLAVLKDSVPKGDWVYEKKYDGYRLLVYVSDSTVNFKTRNSKNWNSKLSSLKREFEKSTLQNMVLDCELVHRDKKGIESFSLLQSGIKKKSKDLCLVAFDILSLGGEDITSLTWEKRRDILEKLQKDFPEKVELAELLEDKDDPISFACDKGWEGVIAKKRVSKYHQSRHESWIKLKCSTREDYLVVGATKPSGGRTGFGALLIAEPQGSELIYKGKVGTGFKHKDLVDLEKKLSKIKISSKPSLTGFDDDNSDIKFWVDPKYFAEIRFSETTSSGKLRHPSFLGLREDKTYQLEESSPEVILSNPDKILFPSQNVSKKQLWEYYESVGEEILRFASNAPLTLVRCPSGTKKKCFFQKHFNTAESRPSVIDIEEKNKTDNYAILRDKLDIKSLVQLGVLEFHIWNSRSPKVEEPLYCVFDLDPGKNINFSDLKHAARYVKEVLERFDKKSVVRTSGSKGLHVLTNLRGLSWEDSYQFSKEIALLMEAEDPQRFTANMSKAKRSNKIFIDYLRNSKGATSIMNFSTRAIEGAPVATPIRWDELSSLKSSDHHNIESIPRRLASLRSHPWQDFLAEL